MSAVWLCAVGSKGRSLEHVVRSGGMTGTVGADENRSGAMEILYTVVSVVVALIAAGLAGWALARQYQRRRQQADLDQARVRFRRRREWLEAAFVTMASERGKPRDLVWADCEFDDPVAFARDRSSGQLRALVGVTISFEAEEGGGMEDVEAVCALRAGTAVFTFDHGTWTSDGRAIFNLNPQQTINRYQHELEILD